MGSRIHCRVESRHGAAAQYSEKAEVCRNGVKGVVRVDAASDEQIYRGCSFFNNDIFGIFFKLCSI